MGASSRLKWEPSLNSAGRFRKELAVQLGNLNCNVLSQGPRHLDRVRLSTLTGSYSDRARTRSAESFPWELFHIDARQLVMRIERIEICMCALQAFSSMYFHATRGTSFS